MPKDHFSRVTSAAVVAALLLWAPVSTQAKTSGTETIILAVEGMSNASCEEYIADSLLGDLDGIREVRADHESDAVTVDFDPAEVSAERIAAAIEDCPSFDVTGSETHDLDEEIIRKNRRSCCSHCNEDRCDRDV